MEKKTDNLSTKYVVKRVPEFITVVSRYLCYQTLVQQQTKNKSSLEVVSIAPTTSPSKDNLQVMAIQQHNETAPNDVPNESHDPLITDSTTVKSKEILSPAQANVQNFIIHQDNEDANEPFNKYKDKSTICQVCGKNFRNAIATKKHMQRHDMSQWGECPICHIRLPDGMSRHIRTHSSERNYQCEFCKKTFRQAYSLLCHKEVHKTGTYTCDICNCGKTFTKLKLKVHMRNHRRQLEGHCRGLDGSEYIEVGKNGKRDFACTECGYTTFRMSNLERHMEKHSRVDAMSLATSDLGPTFSCSHCEKKFKTKSLLGRHEKLHSNTKFGCDECDKEFTVRSYLQKHKRWHRGENKQHTCSQCDRKYVGSKDLRNHMFKIHGIPIDEPKESTLSIEVNPSNK